MTQTTIWLLKKIWPSLYWKIYQEGEKNSADNFKYNRHTFIPIVDSKIRLPLYKKEF